MSARRRRIQNPVKYLKWSFLRNSQWHQSLTIFGKGSVLDIWQGSEYVSSYKEWFHQNWKVMWKRLNLRYFIKDVWRWFQIRLCSKRLYPIESVKYLEVKTDANLIRQVNVKLKVRWCRFENLPICSRSYENTILNISHS